MIEKMLWEVPTLASKRKKDLLPIKGIFEFQALRIIEEHADGLLDTIFLSHLSGENNTQKHALESFSSLNEKYRIEVTSRHATGKVFAFH